MFRLMFTEEQRKLIRVAIYERDRKLEEIRRNNSMDSTLCDAIEKNIKIHTDILSELDG